MVGSIGREHSFLRGRPLIHRCVKRLFPGGMVAKRLIPARAPRLEVVNNAVGVSLACFASSGVMCRPATTRWITMLMCAARKLRSRHAAAQVVAAEELVSAGACCLRGVVSCRGVSVDALVFLLGCFQSSDRPVPGAAVGLRRCLGDRGPCDGNGCGRTREANTDQVCRRLMVFWRSITAPPFQPARRRKCGWLRWVRGPGRAR